MSRLFLHSCLLFAFALLSSIKAHAAPVKPPVTYAVVIGNNRSLGARRPDLHYADDDAARYYEILQTVAPGRVSLLTEFDRDSALLFARVRGQAATPTRGELSRIGAELAQKVRASAAAGQQTQLYFVFAGHGDVDQGQGYIELADTRFTSSDLEAWLRQIPFTRAHVILDSCNSFFMLGVRKPGGRHFATQEDAAKALASRLPNVGVFLSTSAEGEAFEWSEIQSGIFSHVVRSGLLGAADANGDGTVSYLELAGFVETATADVRNANMRPHIYSRGPFSRDDAPIVDLRNPSDARHFRLSDSSLLRVRLRDADGLPVLDAHTEAGSSLQLVRPAAWAKGATVERATHGVSQPAQLSLFAVPEAPGVVALASLEPIAPRGDARGPAEVFQSLFAKPYGPLALASYAATRNAKPPEVYGVSRDDTLRMQLVLGEIEHTERNQRLLAGFALLGGAGVMVGAGAGYYQYQHRLPDMTPSGARTAGNIFFGIGAIYAIGGIYALTIRTAGERAADDFRAVIASGGDATQAFAVADAHLRNLVVRERRSRWIRGILGGTVALISGTALVASEVTDQSPRDRLLTRTWGGIGLMMGGIFLGSAFIESPAERLTKIWHDDPSLVQFQPVVTASSNGAYFGLAGSF